MTAPKTTIPDSVGVLASFVEAGAFGPAEVHLAATVDRLNGGIDDMSKLALAVATRGPRLGHACIDLSKVDRLVVEANDGESIELPWPDPAEWSAALEASAVVAWPERATSEPHLPLVWDGGLLYLQRYWEYEVRVAEEIWARSRQTGGALWTPERIDEILDRVFEPSPHSQFDWQRQAVHQALTHRVSVVAGGPGTGKTRTIAALLVTALELAAEDGVALRVALAAPTGKAATRMTEAVQGQIVALDQAPGEGSIDSSLVPDGQTLHRLLQWRPGTQFAHDQSNSLPYDMVVVDETSMVSLPLMAKLLAALRPAARLVLVGDPLQLASIEAGSVLSDLVGPHRDGPADTDGALAGAITTLTEMHRTEKGSTIPDLAQAIREERLDDVLALLDGSHRDITWVQPHDATALREVRDRVIATSVEVVRAALEDRADDGLRAASKLKVLCATRRGEWGLYAWRDEIEQAVAEAVPSLNRRARWYVGRPIIVTRNDPINHVSNGDVGLVVQRDGSPVVALATGGQPVFLATSRLQQVESWWAMTIHKSQGSEYPETVLSLPTVDSPILTKELIYTGVTRAKNSVTIIASEAMLRTAIARPIARASGLKDRLWPAVM